MLDFNYSVYTTKLLETVQLLKQYKYLQYSSGYNNKCLKNISIEKHVAWWDLASTSVLSGGTEPQSKEA